MIKIGSRDLLRTYKRFYKFYGPQGWWPAETPFEVIVGAILTQNTAWKNVEKAIKNLKAAGALSHPSKISAMRKERLSGLIKSAGYYNVKAKRLKHFMNFLSRRYGNSLGAMARRGTPVLRHELLGVNGIGPETCDSILLYALGRPVFVVDAYTKRIFSRHGLFNKDAGYEEVQKAFMKNLPGEARIFNEFHALIVRLGKEFCRTKPLCSGCPLNF